MASEDHIVKLLKDEVKDLMEKQLKAYLEQSGSHLIVKEGRGGFNIHLQKKSSPFRLVWQATDTNYRVSVYRWQADNKLQLVVEVQAAKDASLSHSLQELCTNFYARHEHEIKHFEGGFIFKGTHDQSMIIYNPQEEEKHHPK
jgi:hypothetical protein